MMIEVLKSKIHRATITGADLHYVGSIEIDRDLMEASGLIANEKVHIYNISNGERLETYVITGPRGSGVIALNGAAARKAAIGDKVIIVSYASMTPDEAKAFTPSIIFPDSSNKLPNP
ncbi:MAG: aspartate 1-decarboxylase [Bacteroidales bacterium]|nr:aspartate 1-decarboxylase [Bacteroidales bacterium]